MGPIDISRASYPHVFGITMPNVVQVCSLIEVFQKRPLGFGSIKSSQAIDYIGSGFSRIVIA
jgi:hypothetical protein